MGPADASVIGGDEMVLLRNAPRPSAGPGPALETFVGEDVSTMMIVNLLSGTEYGVEVLASYGGGSSEPLSGRARTRESLGAVAFDRAFPPSRPRMPVEDD